MVLRLAISLILYTLYTLGLAISLILYIFKFKKRLKKLATKSLVWLIINIIPVLLINNKRKDASLRNSLFKISRKILIPY